MTIAVSPSQSNVQAALRAALIAVLPAGTPVIAGQQNRTAEPAAGDFVIMTPIRRERIETNIDTNADCAFMGSVSGTTLTVTAMLTGTIVVGSTLFGTGVTNNTSIVSQLTGASGGIGAYIIAPSQTVPPAKLACGAIAMLHPVKIAMQLDIHGPASADNAHIISTIMRDDYGMSLFAQSGYDVVPLHAGEALQMPFINGEGQYEFRYVIDLELQANEIISPPQQFADAIKTPIQPAVDAQ